jgi:ribulose-phosphate 3-epimerase
LEAEPSSVNFEVDLMISEPEKVVKKWIEAGAKRLIIHIESTSKMGEIIQIVRTHPNQPGADGQVEIGIALDIDTPNDILDEWTCNDCSSFARADFIQFMGIAKIGYQGQSFDEKVLEKISTLREKYPNAIISVDGAVDSETSPLLIKAGANRLAVGSAVFKNGDVGENIERLRLSAQGGRS